MQSCRTPKVIPQDRTSFAYHFISVKCFLIKSTHGLIASPRSTESAALLSFKFSLKKSRTPTDHNI